MRVVVTRPEPGAARTAARLAALGHQPLLLPLSRTGPLPANGIAAPADADAVAITSANAIRHAEPALLSRLATLPCHAVGRRTAEAARRAGFSRVFEGPGDALGLARTVAPQLAGRTLFYLCGRERFTGFEDCLAAAGVRVLAVETYDTLPVEWPSEAVAACLDLLPADALLLYSARAAQAASHLAARPELAELFAGCRVLALSRRVATAFGEGTARVEVAATPDEEALIGLLEAAD